MTGRTKFVSYHRNSVGIQVSISHGEYRNCQISETKKKFLSKKKKISRRKNTIAQVSYSDIESERFLNQSLPLAFQSGFK